MGDDRSSPDLAARMPVGHWPPSLSCDQVGELTEYLDAWLEFATVYRRFAAVLLASASALDAVGSGFLGGAQ